MVLGQVKPLPFLSMLYNGIKIRSPKGLSLMLLWLPRDAQPQNKLVLVLQSYLVSKTLSVKLDIIKIIPILIFKI